MVVAGRGGGPELLVVRDGGDERCWPGSGKGGGTECWPEIAGGRSLTIT
jgi:hypothetical protein